MSSPPPPPTSSTGPTILTFLHSLSKFHPHTSPLPLLQQLQNIYTHNQPTQKQHTQLQPHINTLLQQTPTNLLHNFTHTLSRRIIIQRALTAEKEAKQILTENVDVQYTFFEDIQHNTHNEKYPHAKALALITTLKYTEKTFDAAGTAPTMKQYTKAYSNALLSLFAQKLPPKVYEQTLRKMPKFIARLKDPKMLHDFLTTTYDSSSVQPKIQLLALNSLFILITQHNLEYPDYYPKLYRNLQSEHITEELLTLIDLSLQSTHVPFYIPMAFAKKLARCSLTSYQHLELILQVISNVLKRYKEARVLIHRDPIEIRPAKIRRGVFVNEENPITERNEPRQSYNHNPNIIDSDPFDITETDLQKTGASQSSLWELMALSKHPDPKIATMITQISNTGKSTVPIEGPPIEEVIAKLLKPKGKGKVQFDNIAIAFGQSTVEMEHWTDR